MIGPLDVYLYPQLSPHIKLILRLIAQSMMILGFYNFFRSGKGHIRREEKERKEVKLNIVKQKQRKRFYAAVVFYIIVIIIFFIKYTVIENDPTGSKFHEQVAITIVPFILITAYVTKKDFIINQIEDKKLKNANHKFTFAEQWHKYVPAEVVRITLGIVGVCAILFVGKFMLNNEAIQALENGKLLSWMTMSIIGIFFLWIWGKYANAFADEKGKTQFIMLVILALFFAILFSI
jgi:hypothetical protein